MRFVAGYREAASSLSRKSERRRPVCLTIQKRSGCRERRGGTDRESARETQPGGRVSAGSCSNPPESPAPAAWPPPGSFSRLRSEPAPDRSSSVIGRAERGRLLRKQIVGDREGGPPVADRPGLP